jgi:uncharacterized repeat protein (TIGR03803 family)
MLRNGRPERTSATLLVAMTAILLLASGAWAQAKYKVLHTFNPGQSGYIPTAGLIFDAGGNLYGTTLHGGNLSQCDGNGCGVVFELAPKTDGSWAESVLYSFCSLRNCLDGGGPESSLIFDKDGNLYGTTQGGGTSDAGTVFQLTPNPDGSWTESVLYSFGGGNDGSGPVAGLIFDQGGNLYGTTPYGGGGVNDSGIVFQLKPTQRGTWTESVLYRFESTQDGGQPNAGLILDQRGNLYGTTTEGGGPDGLGTVFRLTPNEDGSWTESVLYDFCSLTKCRDGDQPYAGLVFDKTGNLYGTTTQGGDGVARAGTVFRLTPKGNGTWKEQVLHSFNINDGEEPFAGLIFDAIGNLYGVTYYGGNLSHCRGNGCGVVFKLSPSPEGGWNETVLHKFVDHPGAMSFATLVIDSAGNLYGTTGGDFDNTHGSVFEIKP